MREHPQYGLEPVGFVDRTPGAGIDLPAPVVGSDVAEAVVDTGVRGHPGVQRPGPRLADRRRHDQGAPGGRALYAVPRMFEMYHDGLTSSGSELSAGAHHRVAHRRPSWLIKRAIDIFVALVALVLASPFLAAIALAVLLESGRPVLFRQTRVGRDGRPFDVLKFRTMRPASDGSRRRTGTSPATRGSARSAGSSAAPRSTSCRSCGTSCAAT